jgi:hypothetical protein
VAPAWLAANAGWLLLAAGIFCAGAAVGAWKLQREVEAAHLAGVDEGRAMYSRHSVREFPTVYPP